MNEPSFSDVIPAVTRLVKTAVESFDQLPYNLRVSKAYWFVALVCVPLLIGGACGNKSPNDTGAISALDKSSGDGSSAAIADTGPVDTTPLPNVDVSKLNDDSKALFYRLLGSLTSPCGKAHSLRTSFTSDTSCKRAPFAVRYVMSLLEDGATEPQTRDEYDKKYKSTQGSVMLDTSKAPHEGPDDAPVRLTEFYDYGCPHCAAFRPMMEAIAKDEAGKVVEYFMQFPLESHHNSRSAAQAAFAAANQGKFAEMHALLFQKQPEQDHAQVTAMAQSLGLDMTKFEADYADPAVAAHVASDLAQGEKAGVDSTPTLFFNNRKYEGPMHPKYIELWIEEEVAVNR
jgi:protein-disulfide isomerase